MKSLFLGKRRYSRTIGEKIFNFFRNRKLVVTTGVHWIRQGDSKEIIGVSGFDFFTGYPRNSILNANSKLAQLRKQAGFALASLGRSLTQQPMVGAIA